MEIFQNTGNFVFSNSKFPDSKGKGYCDICRKNIQFFLEAGYVCQVSFVYVIIVTNHVNWHRESCGLTGKKQGKHEEFENAFSVGTLFIKHVSLSFQLNEASFQARSFFN